MKSVICLNMSLFTWLFTLSITFTIDFNCTYLAATPLPQYLESNNNTITQHLLKHLSNSPASQRCCLNPKDRRQALIPSLECYAENILPLLHPPYPLAFISKQKLLIVWTIPILAQSNPRMTSWLTLTVHYFPF